MVVIKNKTYCYLHKKCHKAGRVLVFGNFESTSYSYKVGPSLGMNIVILAVTGCANLIIIIKQTQEQQLNHTPKLNKSSAKLLPLL